MKNDVKKIGLIARLSQIKWRVSAVILNLISPVPCFANDAFGLASTAKIWAGMIGAAAGVIGVVLIATVGWKVIMGNIDAGKEKMVAVMLGIGIASSATSVGALLWATSGAVI